MAGVEDETDVLEPEVEIEDQAEPEPEGDEEVEVSFGDEEEAPSSEERDTGLVRHLRAEIRKRDEQLAARPAPQAQAAIEVGEKPTYESCGYDEEKFEAELDAWKDRTAAKASAESDTRKAQEDQQAAWNRELEAVKVQKTKLGLKDYDQAAENVRDTLSDVQQAIIVKAASTPAAAATMIYALGKSPARLAAVAAIQDPVKLIAELVRMEGKVSVTTRKAPEPERIARGSAPLSAATDKELERLERKAAQTGDRDEVVRYKRKLKARAK